MTSLKMSGGSLLGWLEALSERPIAIVNLGFLFPAAVFIFIWLESASVNWLILGVVSMALGVYLVQKTGSMRLGFKIAAQFGHRQFRRKIKADLPSTRFFTRESAKVFRRHPFFGVMLLIWLALSVFVLNLSYQRSNERVFQIFFVIQLGAILLVFIGGATAREPMNEYLQLSRSQRRR